MSIHGAYDLLGCVQAFVSHMDLTFLNHSQITSYSGMAEFDVVCTSNSSGKVFFDSVPQLSYDPLNNIRYLFTSGKPLLQMLSC